MEICGDGIDQDCDGADSQCTDTYYRDADGDGFGDVSDSITADSKPEGYVTDGSDCDDSDASIHPGAIEVCEDGIDQNCSGYDSVCLCSLDDDTDGDGYDICDGDCDDDDPDINPGAEEICGDGIDQDCDGTDTECPATIYYRDADGDGYGDPDVSVEDTSCPEGYVTKNTDCDDTDASIHPGAEDIEGDGIDQDCDGHDSGIITFEKVLFSDNNKDEYTVFVLQTEDGGYILVGGVYSEDTDDMTILLIKTDPYGNFIQGWGNNGDGTSNFKIGPWAGGHSILQTPDGGYVMLGSFNSDDYKYINLFLMKIDANGIQESGWGKNGDGTTYYRGSSINVVGTTIEQITDGGYMIGGWACPTTINFDSFLMKTDANGIPVTGWGNNGNGTSIIGREDSNEHTYYAQQTTDGGYMLGGYINYKGTHYYSFYITKTDSNGFVVPDWGNHVDPETGLPDPNGTNTIKVESKSTIGSSMQQTTESGYIIPIMMIYYLSRQTLTGSQNKAGEIMLILKPVYQIQTAPTLLN